MKQSQKEFEESIFDYPVETLVRLSLVTPDPCDLVVWCLTNDEYKNAVRNVIRAKTERSIKMILTRGNPFALNN